MLNTSKITGYFTRIYEHIRLYLPVIAKMLVFSLHVKIKLLLKAEVSHEVRYRRLKRRLVPEDPTGECTGRQGIFKVLPCLVASEVVVFSL